MKKILLLAVFALALVSCGNGLESKAKKQMKKTMLEMAKNPDALKISDIKTSWIDDSLCILSCKVRGQNPFGGYDMSEYQYYYLKSTISGKEKYYENIINIGNEYINNRFSNIVLSAFEGFNGEEIIPYENYCEISSPNSEYDKGVKFLVYSHRNDSTFINNNGDLYLSVHNIAVNMICKTFGKEVK